MGSARSAARNSALGMWVVRMMAAPEVTRSVVRAAAERVGCSGRYSDFGCICGVGSVGATAVAGSVESAGARSDLCSICVSRKSAQRTWGMLWAVVLNWVKTRMVASRAHRGPR